jgi:hypothetical protein
MQAGADSAGGLDLQNDIFHNAIYRGRQFEDHSMPSPKISLQTAVSQIVQKFQR